MRLFVAICLNDDIKQKLCALIESLRDAGMRGRFSRPELLHLTLAFLGETPDARAVIRAVEGVKAERFTLTIAGLGRFRRSGGDILWAGVELSAELAALHGSLIARLKSEGFALNPGEYRPHVTLAREVKNGHAGSAATLAPCRMPVTRISLMKSERLEGRLVYTEIYSKSLV